MKTRTPFMTVKAVALHRPAAATGVAKCQRCPPSLGLSHHRVRDDGPPRLRYPFGLRKHLVWRW